MINKEKTSMNRELFQKHFNFQTPIAMLRDLFHTNNKKKNNDLVNVIKSGWSDLKDEIEKMSENEIELEKPNKMVDIVERILEFNRQNQQGQGLRILTLEQMVSRLPIALAHLQPGNNSEKLKNEIRQLLYFLYRLKELSKPIYKNSISIIEKRKQYL